MPIHVIGLGVAQTATLSEAASKALAESTVVYGSPRQLATISRYLAEQNKRPLPKLSVFKAELDTLDGNVTVLASGDPLFYGIGKWLGRNFAARLRFYPAVSSLQAACHRLGISLQDITVISLHGRSLHAFRREVRSNRQYLFLTDSTHTPKRIAQETLAIGLDESTMTVFERLGYADEKQSDWRAQSLSDSDQHFDPLNVCFLQAKGEHCVLPTFPGIEDHRFITENDSAMITKREVRLAILSLLQPQANDIGWDIGAGCGSVAVEWSLWSKTKVYAIEPKAARIACIEENKVFFGAGNVQVIEGFAPSALADLPAPDTIFVGGSEGDTGEIVNLAYSRLKPKGRLVISSVTEETQFAVQQFLQARGLVHELIEISIKRKTSLGKKHLLKPALPVRLIKVVKT